MKIRSWRNINELINKLLNFFNDECHFPINLTSVSRHAIFSCLLLLTRQFILTQMLKYQFFLFTLYNLTRQTTPSTTSSSASQPSTPTAKDRSRTDRTDNINNIQPPVYSNYHRVTQTSASTLSSSHVQSDIRLQQKASHCNRSDNTSQSCKKDNARVTSNAAISPSSSSSSTRTSSERVQKNVENKSKRYSKTRHKVLSEGDSITPLLVPNILEKL